MPRLERPLNTQAAESANEQLYQSHAADPRPNALYGADGARRPLDANDPAQAGLRAEWRRHYLACGGREEGAPPARQPAACPAEPCPLNETATLIVRVVESANNATIAGASVQINGPNGLGA